MSDIETYHQVDSKLYQNFHDNSSNFTDEDDDADEHRPISPGNSLINGCQGHRGYTINGESNVKRVNVDDIDPFSHHPIGLNYAKIIFNTLWLFPLRLLLIVFPSVIGGSILCLIVTLCDHFDTNNPRPLRALGRFLMNKVGTKLSRMMLFGFGFHWIRVRGRPATTEEAPILIVAPHTSLLDVFIIAAGYCNIPTFVAKEDFKHVPFFGYLVTNVFRPIFVSREDPNSRQRASEEIRRRAEAAGSWPSVLIFPEGTVTNHQLLLKFKQGAFLPKLPVQPVLFKYNNKINTYTWSENGMGLFKGLYFTLCNFHNSLEIEFLPVYTPSQEEMDNPKLYAENVRKTVSDALNMPCGNQSVEDFILCLHARKIGLPFTSGLVTYYKTTEELSMGLDEIKKWLKRFKDTNASRSGFIDAQELADYLRVPNDACVQALVKAAIRNGENGRLGFKDYLYGIIGSGKQLTQNDEFVQAMFNFFDEDRDGIVSITNITQKLPIQSFPPSQSSPTVSRRRGCDVSYQNQGFDSIPSEMNHEQFKSLLELHPEYALLFHKCQNAGVSSPPN